MTLKKTDLAKQMALKIDGKRKAAQIPDRFGKQSSQATASNKATKDDTQPQVSQKLVPVTCRLPADLVQKLREKALQHTGGIHGLMTDAAQAWLSGATAELPKPAAKKATKKTAKKVTP